MELIASYISDRDQPSNTVLDAGLREEARLPSQRAALERLAVSNLRLRLNCHAVGCEEQYSEEG